MNRDVRDLHRRAAEEFGSRVRAIRDDQWHLPTPCTKWDVRDLVHHLVYENRWVPPLMEGLKLEEVGDRFDGDVLGDDPKAAWEESVLEAVRAVQRYAGADRLVDLSYGPAPASDYAFELFSDLLIHAWDLARGIGADDSLDPELVEACYERMKPQEEMLRRSELFGPKVDAPPGADRQTELLALYGRRKA